MLAHESQRIALERLFRQEEVYVAAAVDVLDLRREFD